MQHPQVMRLPCDLNQRRELHDARGFSPRPAREAPMIG